MTGEPQTVTPADVVGYTTDVIRQRLQQIPAERAVLDREEGQLRRMLQAAEDGDQSASVTPLRIPTPTVTPGVAARAVSAAGHSAGQPAATASEPDPAAARSAIAAARSLRDSGRDLTRPQQALLAITDAPGIDATGVCEALGLGHDQMRSVYNFISDNIKRGHVYRDEETKQLYPAGHDA